MTLNEQLWKCYQQGKFSDLTIVYKEETFKVHKLVICPACPVFEAMCKGGFKESETDIIVLDNDDLLDAELLKCFIRFFYLSEYCTFRRPGTQIPIEASLDRLSGASGSRQRATERRSADELLYSTTPPRHLQVQEQWHAGGLFAQPHQPTTIGFGDIASTTTPRTSIFGPAQRADEGLFGRARSTAPHSGSLFGGAQSTANSTASGQRPYSIPQDNTALQSPSRRTMLALDHDDGGQCYSSESSNLLSADFHARMYALADKYDIPTLSKLAAEMYHSTITRSKLRKAEALSSIKTVFTTTPDNNKGLRETLIKQLNGSRWESDDRAALKKVFEDMEDLRDMTVAELFGVSKMQHGIHFLLAFLEKEDFAEEIGRMSLE